jgi:hypothetical protein
LFALIAVAGLAVDGTLIYRAKQDLQRTIDSAALAAAYRLPNQGNATNAAYEYADVHGYGFNPYPGPTLDIGFPEYDPPRKAVTVKGSTTVNLAFMGILGFHSVQISAEGEAEAAPMDVYLVLDLSQSMVYDTDQPSPWPPAGSPCSTWDSNNMYDCVAKYCNWARKCDPLDLHIKPAAKFFIDQLDPLYDRVGLVVYHQYGTKIIELTSDFEAVKWEIDDLNAFDHQGASSSNCPNTNPPGCNKNTNIGDGILVAHNNLASEGRQDAIWSIVLETDGKANIYRSCSTCPSTPPPTPDCSKSSCQTLYLCNECTQAETWAINNAKATWMFHETVIYTIAFGQNYSDYQDLMIDIADCTDDGKCNNGTDNFFPAPDEAALRADFAEIAKRIYSRLLR